MYALMPALPKSSYSLVASCLCGSKLPSCPRAKEAPQFKLSRGENSVLLYRAHMPAGGPGPVYLVASGLDLALLSWAFPSLSDPSSDCFGLSI